jgi:hypothetical protein
VSKALGEFASRGLRILGIADRRLQAAAEAPTRREEAERDLCFVVGDRIRADPRSDPHRCAPIPGAVATAALSPAELLFALPFPFIVWGADELRRWLIRRREIDSKPSIAA